MFTIIYSDRFLQHETGYMHPEQPDRLTAIVKRLQTSAIAHQIQWLHPSGSKEVIQAIEPVHSARYIEEVRAYAELTNYSIAITPKVLFGLEGGYELESLSESVLETVQQC